MPCQVQSGLAPSLDATLGGQNPHEDGTLMAKVDGKTIVHVLRWSTEHCGTIVPPCGPSCYNVQFIMYVPLQLPPNFWVLSPWLSPGHLLLDLHHARFTQHLLMGHGTPQ